ncbi:MAG: DUF1003 domain-containing protein [Gammaproteobacteria bacterium]|jgi:uncharacterized membrane protein
MTKRQSATAVCPICGHTFAHSELVPGSLLRTAVVDEIHKEHPDWSPDEVLCRNDLNRYRDRYVQSLLAAEKGELSSLENEVVRSLREHEILARNVDAEFEQQLTLGERLSDRLAEFGGSWTFLMAFGGVLALWIIVNTALLVRHPFDPYPFILLNLVLSCLAAVQAPVIMMSQNRQEDRDRLRAQHDYQVNMKAELEIRQLHEKIDHMLSTQWQRLVEIQRVQLELMTEITANQTRRK